MSEYRSVWRWLEIVWEKCGVVRNSAEMIRGGIGGNMVHNTNPQATQCIGMAMAATVAGTRDALCLESLVCFFFVFLYYLFLIHSCLF